MAQTAGRKGKLLWIECRVRRGCFSTDPLVLAGNYWQLAVVLVARQGQAAIVSRNQVCVVENIFMQRTRQSKPMRITEWDKQESRQKACLEFLRTRIN